MGSHRFHDTGGRFKNLGGLLATVYGHAAIKVKDRHG